VRHPRSLEVFESLGLVGRFLGAGCRQRTIKIHSGGKALGTMDLSTYVSIYGFNLKIISRTNVPPHSIRLLLIALAGLSLLLGIWFGIARLGFAVPLPHPAMISLHGPLMAIGFLLTLIGLERAVAVDDAWVYGVPLLSVLAMSALILGLPHKLAAIFATSAAALLLLFFYQLFRRQREEHFTVMKLSAALLFCGNLVWCFDSAIFHVVPWWAGFLVVMIVGERLELNRLRLPPLWVRLWLRIALVIFVAGLALTVFEFRLGVRIAGVGLIAMGLWMLRYDLAWQSIKQPGLPRFMARCLILGYFWLLLGGIFWIWFARFFGAGPLYDAMLHSVFVGFVFSMIFAHAPIIFPTITGLALPFSNSFYLHAGLLHISLLARMAGDLALLAGGQKWGGLLNALSILLFLINNMRAVISAR